MGSEQRRVGAGRGGDVEQAPFVGDGEPVSRLDLDPRDAVAQGLGATPGEPLPEDVVAGCPCGRDRTEDPSRLVRRARHAGHELVAPVTGEDEVRVAVDEARDDAPSGGIDAGVGSDAGRLDGDDLFALDDQSDVALQAERAVALLGVVRDQQPDVVDRQRHGTASHAARMA